MKTIETNRFKTAQTFNGLIKLVFMPANMEQSMASYAQTQGKKEEEQAELSVFDVKELYDQAYDEKAGGNEIKFKALLAEAVKLDLAYRRQLAKKAFYKDTTQQESFGNASTQQATGVA